MPKVDRTFKAEDTPSDHDVDNSGDDQVRGVDAIHQPANPQDNPVRVLSRQSTSESVTGLDSKEKEKAIQCAIRMFREVGQLMDYIPQDNKATNLWESILRSMNSMGQILGEDALKYSHPRPNPNLNGVDVLYRVRLMQTGEADRFWYQDVPFPGIDLEKKDPVEKEDEVSILDVIIDVEGTVATKEVPTVPRSENRKEWHLYGRKKFIFGEDIKLTKQKLPAIRIYSTILMNALSKLITYYPGVASDFTILSHPYKVLLLHLPMIVAFRATCENKTAPLSNVLAIPDDKLRAREVEFQGYRNQGSGRNKTDGTSSMTKINSNTVDWKCFSTEEKILKVLDLGTSVVNFQTKELWKDSTYDFQKAHKMEKCSANLAHHIDVLLAQVIERYWEEIVPELEDHMQNRASFDRLWVLFKPGVDVFAMVKGQLAGFVVVSCETRPPKKDPKTPEDEVDQVVVTAWNLAYTGSKLYRDAKPFIIPKFEGTKDICSLSVYPTWCHPKETEERGKLRDRGEKYYNLIRRSPPAHLYYDGDILEGAERYFKPVHDFPIKPFYSLSDVCLSIRVRSS
jgi:hypothetical protein